MNNNEKVAELYSNILYAAIHSKLNISNKVYSIFMKQIQSSLYPTALQYFIQAARDSDTGKREHVSWGASLMACREAL